jgi:hypothetical protein
MVCQVIATLDRRWHFRRLRDSPRLLAQIIGGTLLLTSVEEGLHFASYVN